MVEGAISGVREASDEGQFLLAALPPSKRHIRLAIGIVAALAIAMVVIAPFAGVPLPRIDAFIPVVHTATVFAGLITSALLFSQFFVVGRTSLFALAVSYLFAGLMMIPFVLTFPGAFSSTGLLGAGLQSATYIGSFYRVGAALGIIAYALLRNSGSTTSMSGRSPLIVIIWSVVLVIAIVCGLTWFAVAKEPLLPVIFVDSTHANPTARFSQSMLLGSLNALGLALLWARCRSVLDVWLMVMCCTWLLFQVTMGVLVDERFTLGWYAARGYEVIATTVVLIALLSETTALYAKLGRSIVSERRERDARQLVIETVVTTISHELKQPLGAIAINGHAALRWMARSDFDEARLSINRAVTSAHRVSEVLDSIRSLFRKDMDQRIALDANELIQQVLKIAEVDLRSVSVHTKLREGLPPLFANRAQLEHVLLHLVWNAVEAMHPVTNRRRLLRISSDLVQNSSTVLIVIEDTGKGIQDEDKERIFEPFFTTKSKGMGTGLFVCRAVVEAHGGSLQAFANQPYGTIFQVALPSGKSE